MEILISPVSKEETKLVGESAADIIDIKNVKEGSLGAQLPTKTKELVELARLYKKRCSATIGDLPNKPGTAALAALGMTQCGVDYIKAGIYGPKIFSEAYELINAIVQTVRDFSNNSITIVAAGYADWRRFDGLSPYDLISAASKANAGVVMVDTAIKDGTNLFDVMSDEEIEQFVNQAKDSGLKVALAGSLNASHLLKLYQLNPDIIGLRGAVCEGKNRNAFISKEALSHFFSHVKTVALS